VIQAVFKPCIWLFYRKHILLLQKMHLDFFLVVLATKSSPQTTKKYDWDPYPTNSDRSANLACIWLDPFWTGLTCHCLNDSLCTFSSGNNTASVFRVTGNIDEITPSSMQQIIMLQHQQPCSTQQGKRKTICNSVKVHFFHSSRDGNETRRDFLYSSAFPLEVIVQNAAVATTDTTNKMNNKLFGLFNYNAMESECQPLVGMCLFVRPNITAQSCCILPPHAVILATKGPSPDHHDRVVKICDWIADTLHMLCPDVHTSFCNMRTFCRDMCSTCLFQVTIIKKFIDIFGVCMF